MVEVFKTNVRTKRQAKIVVARIHKSFADLSANFDLEDCDKILRIKHLKEELQQSYLIKFLNVLGVQAAILTEDLDQQQLTFNGIHHKRKSA